MKYAMTWVLLAIGIALGMGSVNWPVYRRIAMRGISGQATVLELHPKMHETVRYKYEVAGRSFQGEMRSWQPNPPLQQLSVGQGLVVYYDPKRLHESVLGDPQPIFRNETISIALMAGVFPTFVVAVWAWRSSGKQADAGVTTQAT